MLKINAFNGYLRVKTPMFKETHVMDDILSLANMVPGVISVESNLRTGSVLVKYDATMLPVHLKPIIESMLPELKELYKKHRDLNYEVYRPYVKKLKALIAEEGSINA